MPAPLPADCLAGCACLRPIHPYRPIFSAVMLTPTSASNVPESHDGPAPLSCSLAAASAKKSRHSRSTPYELDEEG
jgi:hypothetical protein